MCGGEFLPESSVLRPIEEQAYIYFTDFLDECMGEFIKKTKSVAFWCFYMFARLILCLCFPVSCTDVLFCTPVLTLLNELVHHASLMAPQ